MFWGWFSYCIHPHSAQTKIIKVISSAFSRCAVLLSVNGLVKPVVYLCVVVLQLHSPALDYLPESGRFLLLLFHFFISLVLQWISSTKESWTTPIIIVCQQLILKNVLLRFLNLQLSIGVLDSLSPNNATTEDNEIVQEKPSYSQEVTQGPLHIGHHKMSTSSCATALSESSVSGWWKSQGHDGACWSIREDLEG